MLCASLDKPSMSLVCLEALVELIDWPINTAGEENLPIIKAHGSHFLTLAEPLADDDPRFALFARMLACITSKGASQVASLLTCPRSCS